MEVGLCDSLSHLEAVVTGIQHLEDEVLIPTAVCMRGPMAMLDSGAHGDFLFTDSTALVLLAKDISRCEEQELQASATWFAGQVCLIIKHCHWSLGVCQLWQPWVKIE